MQKVISIHEHEDLQPTDSDKLDNSDIRSLKHACKLKVIREIAGGYKTGKMVGLLPLHSCSLEILPKIFKGESEEERPLNRMALLHILAFVNQLPIKESALVGKNIQKYDFYEIMRYLFAKNLIDELQRGVNRSYETIEKNEPFLKGKLVILENIRRNFILRNRFYLCYDEFTEDNSLNRVLNHVVRNMTPSAGNLSRHYLMELSSAFSDVDLDPESIRSIHKITQNRMNERFWPHFQMARMFLGKQISTVYTGHDIETYNFLFDMEKLFESFVGNFLHERGHSISRSTTFDVHTQQSQLFGQLSIKPDIVMRLDKKIIVVDTKYTGVPTDEDSKNSHLYQIYTYCMRQKQYYKDKEVSGVLLYPKHLGENEEDNPQNNLDPVHIGRDNDELSVVVHRKLLDLRIGAYHDFKERFIKAFEGIFAEVVGAG
jgi:5-methylcytosine-specific restriction enzyme subunit McrC